jgi:pimeloyl-ACP methyl ester carboxylesterase
MSSLSEAPINAPYSLWVWNGMRVHFARQGEGSPLLLVHSLNGGASAYEMRKAFVELSKRFEVFAPDLPGFGASERRRMDYTAEGYIQFLKDFHAEHIGRPCGVIASSISAAYVIQVAHDAPERFAKLALIAPTGIRALAGRRRSPGQRAARALLFSPLGTGIFRLLSTRRAIRYFMTTQGFHDPRAFTSDYADHLYRTMRKPNAKYGPTAFLTGAAHWNVADVFGKLQQPTLIVWGAESRTTPVVQAEDFIRRKPDAQLETLDGCALLPHDECSEMFNALVRRFFKD